MGQAKKGSGGAGGKITDAQLAVDGTTGKYPEFKGNVATFYSNPVSKGGSANGHYSKHAETYMNVGVGMGKAMAELLKAAGSASSKTASSTSASTPPSRKARSIAPAKMTTLNTMLVKTLVKLSNAGALGARKKVPLSKAKGPVALVSVQADNTLTFRSSSGNTATFSSAELKPVDFVNLSVLITQLKPDSTDAVALVGVYLESLGRTALADKQFAKAGPESAAKMNSFFE